MNTSSPIVPITYKAISTVEIMPAIDTVGLFAPSRARGNRSPIDRFFENTKNINKLYLPYADGSPTALPPELGAIVVLGYMSAVESYMRSIISAIIRVDDSAREAVALKQVSFAAAAHSNRDHLPEALLENISFADAKALENALTALVGIKSIPNDVKSSLTTFQKICQVRHCCVHRFGKLGTRNALDLGFERHSPLIENPFTPSVTDIGNIADALQITVKTINNFLFYAILDRTIDHRKPKATWQLNYVKDRPQFLTYYKLFAVKIAKPSSPAPKVMYRSFIKEHTPQLNKILTATMSVG
jgi:hypothetical protein